MRRDKYRGTVMPRDEPDQKVELWERSRALTNIKMDSCTSLIL